MFLKQKQEENIVKEDKNYYIVDKAVLPEIFLKVMDVKNLLESKKEKTVQDAVNRVGISRSAVYKYRDTSSLRKHERKDRNHFHEPGPYERTSVLCFKQHCIRRGKYSDD